MPTATETLATIMTSVVTTVVDLATIVITTYWPYVLVISIIGGLITAFRKFAHIGVGAK